MTISNCIFYFRWVAFASFLLCLSATTSRAEERGKPIGQRDGINLHLRFADPLNFNDPKFILELENTTDKFVPFQRQGSSEGPPIVLHLLDSSGKEIKKNREWESRHETGNSIHMRYGAIPTEEILDHYEIDLFEAHGDNWQSGVRLDLQWNPRETRTGPGPFGGNFGVGAGLKGSFDLTTRANRKQKESDYPETVPLKVPGGPKDDGNAKSPSVNAIQPYDSAPTGSQFDSYLEKWAWMAAGVVFLLGILGIGIHWKKRSSQSLNLKPRSKTDRKF